MTARFFRELRRNTYPPGVLGQLSQETTKRRRRNTEFGHNRTYEQTFSHGYSALRLAGTHAGTVCEAMNQHPHKPRGTIAVPPHEETTDDT